MPQRLGILCRPADAERVAAAVGSALAASHPRPAVIDLDRIDATDPVAPLLAHRWPSTLGARLHQPLRGARPRAHHRRGRLRGLARRQEPELPQGSASHAPRPRALGARIAPVEDTDGLDRAIDALRRLHGDHWGSRSSLWTPQACAMLREAGEHMIGSGGMRVYTVEIGGAIVSVEILFAAGGEVSSWNTGSVPAWAEERVSMAGLFAAIEDCFERGDARLDFGEGTQPYKQRLADGDDPVAWATVLARGASYPAASALTARARWKRAARGAARRLPEPALARVRSVKGALRRSNPLHAGAARVLGLRGPRRHPRRPRWRSATLSVAARRPGPTDGLDQGGVVALVLLGVGLAEAQDRPVEGGARPEVGGDRDAVARAGVRSGERPPQTRP